MMSQSARGSSPGSACRRMQLVHGIVGAARAAPHADHVAARARARGARSPAPMCPSPTTTAVWPCEVARQSRRPHPGPSCRARCAASQRGKLAREHEQPRDRGLRDRLRGGAGGGREAHAAREHLGEDRVVDADVEDVQPLELRRLAHGGEELPREIGEHVDRKRTRPRRARTRTSARRAAGSGGSASRLGGDAPSARQRRARRRAAVDAVRNEQRGHVELVRPARTGIGSMLNSGIAGLAGDSYLLCVKIRSSHVIADADIADWNYHADHTLELAQQLIARRSVTPRDAGCLDLIAGAPRAARLPLRAHQRQRRGQPVGAARRPRRRSCASPATPTSCRPARSSTGQRSVRADHPRRRALRPRRVRHEDLARGVRRRRSTAFVAEHPDHARLDRGPASPPTRKGPRSTAR